MERDGAKRIAKNWGFLRLYRDDEEMRKLTSKEDREQARDLQAKLDRLPDVSAWRRSRRFPEDGFRDEDRVIDEIVARRGEADFDPGSSGFPAWGFLKELGEFVHGLLIRYGLEEKWFMPLWVYMVMGKLDPPKRYISVRAKTRALRFYQPLEDHEEDVRTSKRARGERDRVKEELDKDPEIKAFHRCHGWPEGGFPEWSDWERWLEENESYTGEPYEPGIIPVEHREEVRRQLRDELRGKGVTEEEAEKLVKARWGDSESDLASFHLKAESIEEEIDAMAHRLMKRCGKRHALRSREWLQSFRYYLLFGKLYPYLLQRRRKSAKQKETQARDRKIRQWPEEYSDDLVAIIHNGGFTKERVNEEIRKKIGKALRRSGLREEQADKVIREERGTAVFDREMVKDALRKNKRDEYLEKGMTEEEADRRAEAYWTEDRMDRKMKRLDELTSDREIVAHFHGVALDENCFLPEKECLGASDVARIRGG